MSGETKSTVHERAAGKRKLPDEASAETLPAEPTPVSTEPRTTGQLFRGATINRYVVLDVLGAGGMAVVYAAYDPRLSRKVALKLLRPSPAPSAVGQERLLREAQAMAQLKHPNVVTVYDVGSYQDQVYLAMELVEGQSLRKWLEEAPRGWRQVLATFGAAGRGLAAAHAKHIIHRDFKPDNVLVGDDGSVRVADFGLARHATSAPEEGSGDGEEPPAGAMGKPLTRTGTFLGTPWYMAPEQHRRGETLPASDQFSFCVALHEALYRCHPFSDGRAAGELARAVLTGAVREAPRGRDVPSWVRAPILRGLMREPDARWPSMDALLTELGRDPWRTRRRAAAGAGAAALVAAAAALAWRLPARDEACRGGERKLAGVWDQARRREVHAAFAASAGARAFAATTEAEVGRALDAQARQLVAMHTDACEAARRGEQSDAVLDLRMTCLEHRRAELGALVAQLARADDETIGRAAQAVRALEPVAQCADVELLQAPARPPADPAVRARVEALRAKLYDAAALVDLGHAERALAAAEPLAAEARELGYRPALADALLVLGRAQTAVGRYKPAEATLREAEYEAQAARHDVVAAKAAIQLLTVTGTLQARHDEGLIWSGLAQAAIERIGSRASLEADWLSALGRLERERRRFPAARVYLERARALAEQERGADSTQAAAALAAVAGLALTEGRFAEAGELYRRSLAIEERKLGPDHPELVETIKALGNVAWARGENEQALAAFQRVVSVIERTRGPSHPNMASALNSLANAYVRLERNDEALAAFERARAIWEASLGPEHPKVAMALSNIGALYVQMKRPDEARAFIARALAIREKVFGADSPELIQSLNGLGEAALAQRRWDEAEPLLLRAVAIGERHTAEGADLGDSLSVLGRVYDGKGDRARALATFRRELAVEEKALGPDSPELVEVLHEIGKDQLTLGRTEEAAASYERALRIMDPSLPAGRRANLRFQLARAVAHRDRARAHELAVAARRDLEGATESSDSRELRGDIEAFLRR